MTSPSMISRQLSLPVRTVSNDLYWMKKNSIKWLSEHTLEGYVYETKLMIDQMMDIELDLQEMRQDSSAKKDASGTIIDPGNPKLKLKVLNMLKEVINLRWFIQGDGPTYLNVKRVQELNKKFAQQEK